MKTFIKYHLAIPKARYLEMKDGGLFPPSPRLGHFSALEIEPDFEVFHALIKRVGEPWGWTRRPRYYKGRSDKEIKALLKDRHTRLFLLRRADRNVGYCLTAAPRLTPRLRGKLGCKPEHNRFRPDVIEIENFGLFPEHTGKGYGQYFLPAMLGMLFAAGHETVYLSTRSTNHSRVVPFYEGVGFNVIDRETLVDDLIEIAANGQEFSVREA